jgi:hypothetical protein
MQTAPWQGHTGHLNIGPSKWWSWGLAIFLAIMVFFTMIGIAISAIFPYDELMVGWEPEEPGEYPVNGTSEEQGEWNSTKEEWDGYLATKELLEDMEEIRPFQIWSGLIGSLIVIVAIIMLFQQNQTAYKLVYVWLGLSAISQIWLSLKTRDIMNEYYSNFPEFEDSIWMSIQSGLQLGSSMICNVFLLLIVVMCSIKSHDKGQVEESGFHRQPVFSPEQDGTQP